MSVPETLHKEEKKVEYLELIYDLIFVYILGRNNSLMHHVQDGFVSFGVFLGYMLGTLAVIQIWNFTTFYINIYGRNSVRDHISLFINMYLLYYMGEGISVHWQSSFVRYVAAWGLILVNLGVQHLLEMHRHAQAPWERRHLLRRAAIILGQSVLVFALIPLYRLTGTSFAAVPIVFGVTCMMLSGVRNKLFPVDFAHLTERAMLYVVFTFGEMIIAIASYFQGALTRSTVYYSLLAFLIVAGLFLSYGTMYNRILDREKVTNGTGYMLLHVFLLFALNNISVSLEFMPLPQVDLLAKTLLLTGSFILYFLFLFLLGLYARHRCRFSPRYLLAIIGLTAAFAALMLLLRAHSYIGIALSCVYIWSIFLTIYLRAKKTGAPTEK